MIENPFEQFLPKGKSIVQQNNAENQSTQKPSIGGNIENTFEQFLPNQPIIEEPSKTEDSSLFALKNLPPLPGALGAIQSVLNKSGKFGKAVGTASEDVANLGLGIPGAIFHELGKIPEYKDYLVQKTPEVFSLFKSNPALARRAMAGGLLEGAGRFSRAPGAVVDYLSKLGLISPETANKYAPVPSEEEIKQYADQLIGGEHPGVDPLRKLFRNPEKVYAGAKIAQFTNPLAMRKQAIANKVIRDEAREMARHTRSYNDIFNQAERQGYGRVNFTPSRIDIGTLRQIPNRSDLASTERFMTSHSVRDAHTAQSDLNKIVRDSYKIPNPNSEEIARRNAAMQARDYIRSRMFVPRTRAGQTPNERYLSEGRNLRNRYDVTTQSYRQNVTPYKSNQILQEYKRENKTLEQLIPSLKQDRFGRLKAHKYPLNRAETIKTIAKWLVGAEGLNILHQYTKNK